MKKVFLFFLATFILTVYYGCSKDNEILESNAVEGAKEASPLKPQGPKMDENMYSEKYLEEYFKDNKNIDWTNVKDPKLLYSIGRYTDNVYLITYKAKEFGDLKGNVSKIDINAKSWQEAKDDILKVFETNDSKYINRTGKLGDNLPMLLIESTSFKAIEQIVDLDIVSSIEVSDGEMASKWLKLGVIHQTGCDCATPTVDNLDMDEFNNDYTTIDPNVKKPWNYNFHQIDEAWEAVPEDKKAGAGVGIAVIDTGVSEDQENLDFYTDFNSGQSQGRFIESYNMLDAYLEWETILDPLTVGPQFPFGISVLREHFSDTPLSSDDRCGHGTKMAGIIGAPRGNDGNSVGIAYNCDIYAYRALHNAIIITAAEKCAVAASLSDIALNDDIQIVSMSIGQLPGYESDAIKNALEAVYDAGKLMICAAGTSPAKGNEIIVFPATSPLTTAVTGIKTPTFDPLLLPPLNDSYPACDICHKGAEVDFAVVMQHQEIFTIFGESTTLGLYCDGDLPGYVSGASTATSSFAGMAALVWANEGLSATREQILEKLVGASTNGDAPISNYGNGWVDINLALQ